MSTKPTQLWNADSTYVWTLEGWLYLAVAMDLFSRHIGGWAMDERMKNKLTLDALAMACWRRKPPKGFVHFADCGSQYVCRQFQKRLKLCEMILNMGRKAYSWDNAPVERFFGSLKSERLSFYLKRLITISNFVPNIGQHAQYYACLLN